MNCRLLVCDIWCAKFKFIGAQSSNLLVRKVQIHWCAKFKLTNLVRNVQIDEVMALIGDNIGCDASKSFFLFCSASQSNSILRRYYIRKSLTQH